MNPPAGLYVPRAVPLTRYPKRHGEQGLISEMATFWGRVIVLAYETAGWRSLGIVDFIVFVWSGVFSVMLGF
jgi:hypothetical protein